MACWHKQIVIGNEDYESIIFRNPITPGERIIVIVGNASAGLTKLCEAMPWAQKPRFDTETSSIE
jgi:hypothetical protein